MEILALTLLVAGVTAISAAGLMGIGGGAAARTEFARDFLFSAGTVEGIELFYNDMMGIAVQKALEEKGHSLDNFCALSVEINDDLKNSINDKAEALIGQYENYKGYKLPHMKTSDGATGALDIKIIESGSWTQGDEKPYSYKNSIAYNWPKEYYVTEIWGKVAAGGENSALCLWRCPTVDIKVEAKNAAGNVVCTHNFGAINRHEYKDATFSCEGVVKKVEAIATNGGAGGDYVDRFEVKIKTPGLSYLEINGKPAKKIEVKSGIAAISSPGSFSAKINTNADTKPDLAVTSITLKDSSGNPLTAIEAGHQITIEAEVANLGCAKISKSTKVIIEAAGTKVLDTDAGTFDYAEKKIFTATWTPPEAGTPSIKVTIDPDNKLAESNEGNNEKYASTLFVSGYPDLKITNADLVISTATLKAPGTITKTHDHTHSTCTEDKITHDFGGTFDASEFEATVQLGGGLGGSYSAKADALDSVGNVWCTVDFGKIERHKKVTKKVPCDFLRITSARATASDGGFLNTCLDTFNVNLKQEGQLFSATASFTNSGTNQQVDNYVVEFEIKDPDGNEVYCLKTLPNGVIYVPLGLKEKLTAYDCKTTKAGTYTARAKFLPAVETTRGTAADNEVIKTFTVS